MAGPIVIVGAGQAGAKCAETLRRLGFDGPITMVGDEAHPPYQRPPLSKKFLAGEMDASQLWLNPSLLYERERIELLTGAAAARIDRAERAVVTQCGRRLPYWKLLVATGSRARRLRVPGGDLAGVHVLRGIDDVVQIQASVAVARRIVIVGGGYIGLEVAAVLRGMGREVVVVEAQARLLQRVVSPEVSRFFHELHSARGVDIRTGCSLHRLVGEVHVAGVETSEGSIPADAVLVAVGSEANDELAWEAGLATDAGIIVDAYCHAGDDIFAAGDCARFPSRRYGGLIRLESVQNATDQARAAAACMLGAGERYDPVPWFWSDQYDIKLQIAGLGTGHDRVEITSATDGRLESAAYFAGERLLAVDALNAPRAHMMARRRLADT